MQAEIIKIDPPQKSRNGGTFIRIYFKLKNKEWAKMDLVPGFRNFKRWKSFLKVGNIVGNLEMKDEKTVDADSLVRLCRTEDELLREFSKLYL